MRNKRRQLRFLLTSTVVLLAAVALSPAALAGCGGRTPGDLEIELKAAVQNPNSNNGTVMTWWRTCLEPDFLPWSDVVGVGGGSNNLPVVSAAIGLYREPNAKMRNADGTTSTTTYVTWWGTFLGAQLGDVAPPQPNLRYFKGIEPFSNTYDGPVVTSVIAARYWAQRNNNAQLADYARRYLRANWAVYGLAAGTGPTDLYFLDGRTPTSSPSATPAPNTEYSPWSPIRPNGGYRYGGHFLALAGARSTLGHWSADDRFPLFDRAIQYVPNPTNENPPQKDVLVLLESLWPAGQTENLYGLGATDRSALNTLLQNGTNANTFLSWLTKIRIVRTFRILGWPGFRASSMEGNPNSNTPCMYGVSYRASDRLASFLFPWTDRNGGGAEGWARLEMGRLVASNEPGTANHPVLIVSLTLPTTQPQFHVVLSKNAEPYLEGTPPTNFPPRDPPEIDVPRNP
jgi:hypothetical protein